MAEFVRSAGRIIKVIFTAAEKKAINEEAVNMIREASHQHEKEELAIVAWQLHHRLGWGEKRIADFLRDYYLHLKQLNNYYQVDAADTPWLCSQKLMDNGINWDKIYDSIKGKA